MSWNYRIVKYADGTGYGLHEVYYDIGGKETAMTRDPITFTCDLKDGPADVQDCLQRAYEDAIKHPVFNEPKEWNNGMDQSW